MPDVDHDPHLTVLWANAISTHGRESECFADRAVGLAAAADGRRPWNNTRVEVYWHEPHARTRERQAIRGPSHRHVWGLPCRQCDAAEAHREQSAALVDAARLAAGDTGLSTVTG